MPVQSVSFRKQLLFWLAVGIIAALLIWGLRGILLPFIMGLAVAYFLDPVVDVLERWGFSRLWATVLITILFGMAVTAVLILLLPILYVETLHFLKVLPGYIEVIKTQIPELGAKWFGDISLVDTDQIKVILSDITKKAAAELPTTIWSVASGSLAVINLLSLILITPVVAFYLLKDWDDIVGFVNKSLPREHADTVRTLAGEINSVLAGFVRGQVTILIFLGVYYVIGLSLIGVKFGVLIGIVAGLISFIPFVGSLTGFIVAVIVAMAQFLPDWTPILLVVAVFASGQMIEGYLLTPKIVGDNVKLHPVWLIFSLFVFGYLLGFLGLLIAVPVSAAIGVLVRFAFDKYYDSSYYRGEGDA